MRYERTVYQEKKDYIEGLRAFLSAHPDFKDINYVHLFGGIDEEYIKLDFVTGPLVMNVTGKAILEIALNMARYMSGLSVDCIITNIYKLRAIDKAMERQRRIA